MRQITISGRAGGDVETKQIGDKYLAKVSVAVSYPKGQGEFATDWYRVNVWSNKPHNIPAGIKGCQCMTTGNLKLSKWTNKDGLEQVSLEVDANDFIVNPNSGRSSQPPQTQSEPQGVNMPDFDMQDVPF